MEGDQVISVKKLSRKFKQYKKSAGLKGSVRSFFKRDSYDIVAVDDVSFSIDKGEFVGFIGPNGAGKTTTMKCLSGLLYPTSGQVKVLGYTPWERKRSFLRQISLVMGQKNQLWWDLPAIDSFSLNKEIYEIEDKFYKERLGELVELLEMKDFLNVQVRKLSLGQRMRCELAVSLLHDPKILFLDEPTIGLDVIMQNKLRNFFREYNKLHSTTVMLTSHYMEDVKELASRVIVINEGKFVYDGGVRELIKKYVHVKNIAIITRKPVKKEVVEEFGEVTYSDDYNFVISVKRENVPAVSSAILKKLPIEDLDIREVGLDEVVRGMFEKKVVI